MAALQLRLLQVGQVPQHGQARLPLQHGLQAPCQHGGAVGEEDGRDVAGLAEVQQAPDLGRQGQAGPLWPHRQQDGQLQRVRRVPRAGPVGGPPQAVVKAHGPLHHRRAAAPGIAAVLAPDRVPLRQEQIQVPAVHPQGRPVEHGVDVVRAALEGAGVQPPPLQRAQQGAGQHRLAAPRGGGGQDQLNHGSFP